MAATTPRAPVEGTGLAIGLVFSAAMILITVLGHGWLELHDFGRSGGVGPLGVEYCEHVTSCTALGWGELSGTGSLTLLAHATLIAGAASAAVALVAAGLVLARRLRSVAFATTRLVIVCGIAVASTWLVLVARDESLAMLVNVGVAGPLCIVAMVVSLALVHRLAKRDREAARPTAGISTAAAMWPPNRGPGCVVCQRPLLFVARYHAYYCEACQCYRPDVLYKPASAARRAHGHR